jgi:hypothetical protein
VVTPGAVWATATQLDGVPPTPTAKIIKLDLVTKLPTTYTADAGYNMANVTALPNGSVWYLEVASTGGQVTGKIGKIDSTGLSPPISLPNNPSPYNIAAGPDDELWFLERVGNDTKVAKLTITNNVASASPEYTLGPRLATELIAGPDNALWLIEFLGSQFSITKMTTTGVFEQHGLGTVFPFALANADNALWFTTNDAGNVGRMTPGGAVSLFCDGASHPSWITTGPGAGMVTFGEFDARIGRLDTATAIAAGPSPCPVPAPPVPGLGGGGGTKKVVKDNTPAKISLSGPRTQRFTNRGTIVVSVKCNEACRAVAQAAVSVSGASKVYRSRNAAKQLAAGKAAKLTLKFQKNAVRAIVRSLRKRKRLKATLLVGTRDMAGNASRTKRIVKLKR